VLIRDALEKHLKDLKVARQEQEAEMREYARLVLRALFAEDRNECLTENTIRLVGKKSLGLN
jgi:2-hydroxychromene-2-carboxylate isomerase